MLSERLNELMSKPLAEIMALPATSAIDARDSAGHRLQCVTWCDRLSPDKYRVVVSLHRKRVLGFSSVVAAEGFIVDAAGKVERLQSTEARALLR